MRSPRPFFLTAVAAALAAAAAPAGSAADGPQTYDVVAAESELVVFLYRDGVASRLAHDHVVAARVFSGTVVYDPDRPEDIRVSITVRADSLEADDPEVVARHRVRNDLGARDRAKVEEALKGEDQLHVERYPTISFRSEELRVLPDDSLYLSGALTLRGVERPVGLRIRIEQGEGTLRASGQLALRQSEFGYEPYSALLGAIRVKDRADIRLDIVVRIRAAGEDE